MKPTISIIVPVYNVEKYLHQCLDSILAQTFTDWECILVDDGSKDNSGHICDEYAGKDGRFKVVHKLKEGVSSARNNGINNAKGTFITFLDADDSMNKKALDHMLSGRDYSLVVIGHENFGCVNKKEGPAVKKLLSIECDLSVEWDKDPNAFWWFVWGKLYRTDIIKENDIKFHVGMKYLEDFCFVMDYLSCVDNVYMIPSYDIRHLIEPTKYDKYKMNYSELKVHMTIHEKCFDTLENKCNCIFHKMRNKISYRHIYNFQNYLLDEDISLRQRLNSLYLYVLELKKTNIQLLKEAEFRSRRLKVFLIVLSPFILLHSGLKRLVIK